MKLHSQFAVGCTDRGQARILGPGKSPKAELLCSAEPSTGALGTRPAGRPAPHRGSGGEPPSQRRRNYSLSLFVGFVQSSVRSGLAKVGTWLKQKMLVLPHVKHPLEPERHQKLNSEFKRLKQGPCTSTAQADKASTQAGWTVCTATLHSLRPMAQQTDRSCAEHDPRVAKSAMYRRFFRCLFMNARRSCDRVCKNGTLIAALHEDIYKRIQSIQALTISINSKTR